MISERYAVGLDIGGTFTDLVLLDHNGGVKVHKLLTTPSDPAVAALQGVSELLTSAGVAIDQVELLVHSTTLVTNALIQQQGARVGLLTTRGFRDVLELRDEHRYDIYDLFLDWPPPLVPRDRRLPITERITRDGAVLAEPQEAEVAEATDKLLAEAVEAIAISFIHSYRDPKHEQMVGEWVRRRAPGIPVTLSSDVAPVLREYDRTCTAVADAYVRPLSEAYLSQMENGLKEMGFRGRFYLMLSGGGSASVAAARQYPIRLVESGPAAGALAAGLYGQLTNSDPILSFDMGGTTAKACVIEGDRPQLVNVLEVARTQRFKRGSGMPLVIPSVELLEIGAGGGSIARIDPMGLLKVGPDSAGAMPGPVCYGLGGTLPTVTDANLVLGYYNPDYFLGGRMRLNVGAARDSLGSLAEALGMSLTDTAWGIHQVVNQNMAQAARMHLIERNFDPRKTTVVAFGGAGPAHAAAIAGLLGARRLVYPLGAGATSALGCLAAPLSFQFTRSLPGVLDELQWGEVNSVFAELERRGREALEEAGVPASEVRLLREADVRIYGQIHEITIPLPDEKLGVDRCDWIREQFGGAYRKLYTRYNTDAVLEVVNWKLTARGPAREVELRSKAPAGAGVNAALKGSRPVFFGNSHGYADTRVYDRYLLSPGSEVQGPAIVEEREASVAVPPWAHARADEYWNLIVELRDGENGRK